MEILKVEHVMKTYGKNRSRVKAANDVSFAVEKGSFTSIIGRSGCGKSTLLKICGGLLKPDSGSVILDGQEITGMSDRACCEVRKHKIGFIFQDFELIPEFNVLENICLPLYLDQRTPNDEQVAMLLHDTGLIDKQKSYPDELSGGEQQRVAIARALITKPAILLADEPTGNLDIKTSEEIMALLNFCNFRYQQTILMVTHNLELLQRTRRVIHMEDGRIIQDKSKGLD